jgi:outer membrane receptor protein involved in Fe transport
MSAISRGAAALVLAGLCTAIGSPAPADDVESVFVIGDAPADIRTIAPVDVSASHALTVTDLINENIPSAFLSDTESNPFQKDLYYRGFDASPVLGTAQGLAIYQGSTRINQRFGDTILWDLMPSFAIRSVDVVPGSDPVFGLNALGGAIVFNMKTGFDMPAGEQFDIAGGSYGRARIVGEAAGQFGDEAFYLGASATEDSGWRRSSASQVYTAYGDFAARAPKASGDISVSLATDSLNENGAAPVQDNAVAAFAIPDTAKGQDFLLQGHGEYDFAAQSLLRGSAYVRATHIETANGQASGFAPCAGAPAILCDGDGNQLETEAGQPITSGIGGDGTDGVETIATTAYGASIELDRSDDLFAHDNSITLGNTVDYATTGFGSSTLLGNLTFQPGGTTTMPFDIYLGGPQYNVRLETVNFNEGLYAQDMFALTSTLSLEVSGRYHFDRVDLKDRLGGALSGDHRYAGLNPALELVWKPADGITAYAEFEQSSRTPTAAELSCSNPAQPCLFPLSFISDPNLKQVIARTIEAGVKGDGGFDDVTFAWSADVYATRNENDIIFESSGPFIGSGFFANIGATQRIGAEISVDGKWRQFDFRGSYGFVNATFESAFTDLSPNNPAADANGNIFVKPGDRMPNVPRSSAKLRLGYQATSRLHIVLEGLVESVQFLRGDEANLQQTLPGYVVFNADIDYQLTSNLQLYIEGENIFDRHYATFGLYGEPSGNGTFPQFTNPRFIVPAEPVAVWAGVRAQF